jgi:hypothetical protein
MCRTPFEGAELMDILKTDSAAAFSDYLCARNLKEAPHWTFSSRPKSFPEKLRFFKKHRQKVVDFRFRGRLLPTRTGYRKLAGHYEDLYFMRRNFALRYDWFLPGRRMYFEDIQLCDIPVVCELGRELAEMTAFPVYFNLSRIYHVKHAKFYYQLQDSGFTDALLALETDEPLLKTLKEAIRMYRTGTATLTQALRYTRENAGGTGTQNLNYKYHMEVINNARSGLRQRPGITAASVR